MWAPKCYSSCTHPVKNNKLLLRQKKGSLRIQTCWYSLACRVRLTLEMTKKTTIHCPNQYAGHKSVQEGVKNLKKSEATGLLEIHTLPSTSVLFPTTPTCAEPPIATGCVLIYDADVERIWTPHAGTSAGVFVYEFECEGSPVNAFVEACFDRDVFVDMTVTGFTRSETVPMVGGKFKISLCQNKHTWALILDIYDVEADNIFLDKIAEKPLTGKTLVSMREYKTLAVAAKIKAGSVAAAILRKIATSYEEEIVHSTKASYPKPSSISRYNTYSLYKLGTSSHVAYYNECYDLGECDTMVTVQGDLFSGYTSYPMSSDKRAVHNGFPRTTPFIDHKIPRPRDEDVRVFNGGQHNINVEVQTREYIKHDIDAFKKDLSGLGLNTVNSKKRYELVHMYMYTQVLESMTFEELLPYVETLGERGTVHLLMTHTDMIRTLNALNLDAETGRQGRESIAPILKTVDSDLKIGVTRSDLEVLNEIVRSRYPHMCRFCS
jgi:hypothetical protein